MLCSARMLFRMLLSKDSTRWSVCGFIRKIALRWAITFMRMRSRGAMLILVEMVIGDVLGAAYGLR